MASASKAARVCMLACRRAPRVQRLPRAQHWARHCTVAQRAFGTSATRWAWRDSEDDHEDEEREDEKEKEDDEEVQDDEPGMLDKMIAEKTTVETMTMFDELAKLNGHNTIEDYVESTMSTPQAEARYRELDDELYEIDLGDRPTKSSFWYDEDDPETNTDEHDEFDEDDITSMAHGKLDEVREMRNYARLAVWEMPLLSRFAKPFVPPTDDQVLRWRYTTYMGESHPAEKKVVVQFSPDDLKLTPVQTDKLKKLVGARYNPETELVKMSCESFEHQAQNKRYLSDLVDNLIAAAKDPTDTFEDIPLDLRHHVKRTRPKFPPEWRLTHERRLQLEEHRRQVALADAKRDEAGLLLDGKKVIDDYLTQHTLETPESVETPAATTTMEMKTPAATTTMGMKTPAATTTMGMPPTTTTAWRTATTTTTTTTTTTPTTPLSRGFAVGAFGARR